MSNETSPPPGASAGREEPAATPLASDACPHCGKTTFIAYRAAYVEDLESRLAAATEKARTASRQRDEQIADKHRILREYEEQAITLRSALAAERAAGAADTARLDWLGTHLAGDKWADTLPHLRPVDALGEYTEKYIGGPESLRAAIDAQLPARALAADRETEET